MNFADINVKIAIAYALFLIVFLLMYIAYKLSSKPRKQSRVE